MYDKNILLYIVAGCGCDFN